MEPAAPQPWYARPVVMATLCVGLAFLIYAPATSVQFYNDDAAFLNAADRVLEQPARLLSERPLGYFRPVYLAFVSAQRAAFGLAPGGYLVSGIVLHGLVGWLVYLLGRRLLADAAAAAVAGLTYVALFAHSEAVLWVAAQNSALVCGLSVLAVLAHLRAADAAGSGRPDGPAGLALGAALAAALATLAALLCKETGIVVLAWIVLAEAALRGPRRLLDRATLARYALLAVVVVVWAVWNGRLGEAVGDEGEGTRRNLGYVTTGRLFGTVAWMFSPFPHRDIAGFGLIGAGIVASLLALLAWRRRDLLPVGAASVLMLLAAALPTCMTRVQLPNGSRLYDFPTVGAALLAGAVFAAVEGRFPRRMAAFVVAIALGAHAHGSRFMLETFYRPLSRAQTATAVDLGPLLQQAGERPVIVLEPWIDNLGHMQQFLQLYWDVDPDRVSRRSLAREEAEAWLAATGVDDAVVLDYSQDVGLAPATGLPGTRRLVRGLPPPQALVQGPRVRMMRIAPPDPAGAGDGVQGKGAR